ncbi:MAG TPA: AmmeMemoRadiSam system protein B [Gammaproteobacteria bacterium]
MQQIRQPAVAGLFYPADTQELTAMIDSFLAATPIGREPPPKAIIVPHAGYIYSGPVAAAAYRRLEPLRGRISRVVLLGPSHRVGFIGLAVSSADQFHTPLGDIALDRAMCEQLATLPQVHRLDQAHAMEHSLEVQLPFLQRVLDAFQLVPLVVGEATAEEVAEVLDIAWGGEETLIVISSDLSHYHSYAEAQRMDRSTCHAIEALKSESIDHEGACGRNPVIGLLQVARRKGLTAHTLDLRNSGDTAGSKESVVGYGAWSFN